MPFRLLYGMASPAQHTGPGMMRGLASADGVMVVPPHGVQLGETGPRVRPALGAAASPRPHRPGTKAKTPLHGRPGQAGCQAGGTGRPGGLECAPGLTVACAGLAPLPLQ